VNEVLQCVLCNWKIDWLAPPIAAYLPGDRFPLTWYPDGPHQVFLSDPITPESVWRVACVAHWAKDHPEQLKMALGGVEVELHHGVTRQVL
jgi:hypothetical protein